MRMLVSKMFVSQLIVYQGGDSMRKFCQIAIFVFLGCIVLIPSSRADDAGRIERLEQEVGELRQIVNRLVTENQSLRASVTQGDVQAFVSDATSSETAAPKLEIRGFGHVQYDYSQSDYSDETQSDTNHFTNGGVDLFITSKIADKISFLNETVFEFGSNGANVLDVERVLLKYDMEDWLKIAIGRGHTSLGYWNQQFHHGTWLQTTASRPIMYRFEDDGGILPVHFVGLEFSGILEAPGGSLSYASNVANGRGTIADEIQLIEDDNDSKMMGMQFTYEPEAVEGLGVGANYLRDTIPPALGTTNRGAEIDEEMYGMHILYLLDPYEMILEGLVVDHDNHATDLEDKTVGAYGQLAYKIGKYKPYFRYDWLRIADRDPFFGGSVEDETSYTMGLRYELTSYNALKLEYRSVDKDGSVKNEAVLQSSFAF